MSFSVLLGGRNAEPAQIADKARWSLVREMHRPGVTIALSDELEWFRWEPRAQRLTLAAHLPSGVARRTVAIALAHRALGHWGETLDQDRAARLLAYSWLGSDMACPSCDHVLAGPGANIGMFRLRLLGYGCEGRGCARHRQAA